jgi:hypothetical protein
MIFFQVQVKDIKCIFNAHLIGKLSNQYQNTYIEYLN